MKKLSVLLLTCISFLSFGINEENDSLVSDTVAGEFRFVQNLDSLLNLWYVSHAIGHFTEEPQIISDSMIVDFPDSVYIARLDKLFSPIELSYNDKVKAYIDVYTKRRRKQVGVMLGLSDYYFPIFEEELSLNDMPLELKYLPVIESALNPRAVSRAGASGLWQFMYTTGKLYHLEINSYVDERLDPIEASKAAVCYLSDLYNIYHDWTLALAAYNCGPGNVNKAIRRSKGETNYWKIYPHLPRETRGYVPAFIAATYVLNYYKEHNIIYIPFEMPIAIDTVTIREKTHLEQISHVLGVPMRQLKDLNPQYKKDIIPAGSRTYSLLLPMPYTTMFIDLEDSIHKYNDSVYFNPKNAEIPDSKTTASANVPDPPSKDMVKVYYKVKSGDNIGFISSWFNVRSSDIQYWNNIRRNLIKANQKLVIYVHKDDEEKYKKIDSMSFAKKQAMIGKSVQTEDETPIENGEPSGGEFVYYTVKSGDNFWSIAKKFPGVSNTDIMRLNNISDSQSLTPGQKLKIKAKDS